MCSVALTGANRLQNTPSGRPASSKSFCIITYFSGHADRGRASGSDW
jgi:hypothetical protein